MNFKNILLILSLYFSCSNISYLSTNVMLLFIYNKDYLKYKFEESKSFLNLTLIYPHILKNYMNSIHLLILEQDNYIEPISDKFNTTKEFNSINDLSHYLDNLNP